MARPIKTVEFHSEYGDLLVMTMDEFLTEMEIDLKDKSTCTTGLHRKTGKVIDGERWRVGAEPEVVPTKATHSQMATYHFAEQDLLSNPDLEIQLDLIDGYESVLIIEDAHRMTNAHLVAKGLADKIELNPTLNFTTETMNKKGRIAKFVRSFEHPKGIFPSH